MPHHFGIRLKEKATESECSVVGEIPDAEWSRLIDFADEVLALENSEVFNKGFRVRIKFSGSDSGLDTEIDAPSDDEVAALLHRIRPFVLQNERTNFFRVASSLARYLAHTSARNLLAAQRRLFSGEDFQSQLRINFKSESTNCIVNSEEVLTTWLNAFEYHRDLDKQRTIQELHKIIPAGAPRAIFLSMLVDKVRAIVNVAVIVRTIERNDGVPLSY